MLHVVSAVKWKLWLQSFTPELSNPGYGLRKKQHLSLLLMTLGRRPPRSQGCMHPQGTPLLEASQEIGTKCPMLGPQSQGVTCGVRWSGQPVLLMPMGASPGLPGREQPNCWLVWLAG